MKAFNVKSLTGILLAVFVFITFLPLPASADDLDDGWMEWEEAFAEDENDPIPSEDTAVEQEQSGMAHNHDEAIAETVGESKEPVLATEAYEFFKAAGFLVPQLSELSPQSPITRAQFLSVVGKLCNLSESGPWSNIYWDVPLYHWAAPYIYGMRDLKYVNGFSETEFRPDAPITWGQVLKIAVYILGYGPILEKGNVIYPDTYVMQAGKLRLLPDGISAYDNVSNEEAFDFLYETVQSHIILMKTISSGSVTYVKSTDSFLAEYHGIYSAVGRVSFNGESGLNEQIKAGHNNVIIGGQLLLKNNVHVRDMLGMQVEYFYRDNGGQKELIYATPTGSDNVIVIDAGDLAINDPAFSADTICYFDNDKLKYAHIEGGARFIYNGRCDDSYNGDSYKIEAGTLKLVSYTGGKSYNLIIAEEPSNCFVSVTDPVNKILHDAYGGILDLSGYKSVEIYNASGEALDFEDIKVNNVVTYIADVYGEHIVLYVSNRKVSGVVEVVNGDQLKTSSYTIDDKEYELAVNVRRAIQADLVNCSGPVAGLRYTFYLDKNGYIGGIDATENEFTYALLCKYAAGSGLDMYGKLMLQVVLDNGAVSVFYTANSFTVNDVASTAEALKSKIDSYSAFPLLRLSFNGKGEIRTIEFAADTSSAVADATAYGYDDTKFSLDYYNAKSEHRGGGLMVFDGNYRLNPDSVVFLIPKKVDGTAVEAEDIKIENPYDLVHRANYSAALYDADATLSARAAVITEINKDYDDYVFVVDKVSTVINKNGETATNVKGFSNGKYISITEKTAGIMLRAKKSLAELRPELSAMDVTRILPGDVFKFVSSGGEAEAAKFLYSLSLPKSAFVSSVKDQTRDKIAGTNSIIVGSVYALTPYALSTVNPVYADVPIASGMISAATTELQGLISTHTLYNTVVLVYNSKKNKVTLGTLADVGVSQIPAKDGSLSIDGSNTWVLIHRAGDTAYEIVVIK